MRRDAGHTAKIAVSPVKSRVPDVRTPVGFQLDNLKRPKTCLEQGDPFRMLAVILDIRIRFLEAYSYWKK